jgi:hypothetical protein
MGVLPWKSGERAHHAARTDFYICLQLLRETAGSESTQDKTQ